VRAVVCEISFGRKFTALAKGPEVTTIPLPCRSRLFPPATDGRTKQLEQYNCLSCWLKTLSSRWIRIRPTAGRLSWRSARIAGPNPLSTEGADAPDPSGGLDARLESQYGIVLVSALPQRPDDPWIGQADVADAGSPQAVLDALNPQLSRNLVNTSVEQHDQKTYYTYELNNTATKFANRRLVKVAPTSSHTHAAVSARSIECVQAGGSFCANACAQCRFPFSACVENVAHGFPARGVGGRSVGGGGGGG
jgi:hypothetical protein